MFQTLKRELNIRQVFEDLTETSLKEIGTNTWCPEDDICPSCGHKNCFRIKDEGVNEESFAKCFSEDLIWDATSLVAKLKDISNVEAAKLLAKTYKIKLPNDYSPVQEVFGLAAEYYHTCLLEAGPQAELGGLTPIEYIEQVRKHSKESIHQLKIGWSDGGLVSYLSSVGVDEEIIKQSGFANKKGGDFLPAKTFLYPHFVRHRCSDFTFKDPLKQKEWQLPNKFKLNGHMFYGSDSISKEGPVIVVEGENDLISVMEEGWHSGILCTIGSISAAQIEWLSVNLANRDVITIFDTDPAGDKYREKVGKIRKSFKTLTQIKLSSAVKDIDEYLKNGGSLEAALENNKDTSNDKESSDTVSVESDEQDSGIVEKKGAYYKIRYKEGNEFLIKLTNFTIKLRNIFIRGNEREREITIKREDGMESFPFMIPSEAKVSLKPFKTLIANAVDASFYGKEEDMIAIWEYVYSNSKETVVHLPEMVGRVDEFRGWLFADIFISDCGALYEADENGVIWIQNHSVGIRAQSMETNIRNGNDMVGVPRPNRSLEKDEREALIKGVLENLSLNLGKAGDALNVLGWAWACVYSDQIFDAIKHFPFLYLWGKGGQGKTSIFKWILNFFDIEEPGWNPVSQLNSGVSFSRKLSYYSSLPLCLDEVRMEKAVQDLYGTFRVWYNRGGRTVSAKEGFGVKTQPVRSTLMFGGEDQFMDQSTRDRCIHIRISKHGREMVNSYQWIDSRKRDLSSIGYHWITGFSDINVTSMIKDIKSLDNVLRQNGISSRTSLNWAIIAFFAKRLAEQYMPGFDYMSYLFSSAKEDIKVQKEDDTVNEFWNVVEGLQSEERAKISGDHLRKEGDKLYVWFTEVFRIVDRESSSRGTFSRRAILEAIKDEEYFTAIPDRKAIGMNETVRRVITIDLTTAPEVLQNIAACLG